jgi:hypothetical protein
MDTIQRRLAKETTIKTDMNMGEETAREVVHGAMATRTGTPLTHGRGVSRRGAVEVIAPCDHQSMTGNTTTTNGEAGPFNTCSGENGRLFLGSTIALLYSIRLSQGERNDDGHSIYPGRFDITQRNIHLLR